MRSCGRWEANNQIPEGSFGRDSLRWTTHLRGASQEQRLFPSVLLDRPHSTDYPTSMRVTVSVPFALEVLSGYKGIEVGLSSPNT